jgi:hypothetical protein
MDTKNHARRISRRLSYSNVIATLALFIALGGVSWAAVKLPKNSVTTKTIKKGAVTNVKIKRSAVDSRTIKNSSIVGADIKPGTLTGTQINLGSLGVVPAAATANDQFHVTKTSLATATDAVEATARAAATEVPLASNSQVSIYGKCFKVGAALRFETYGRTTANGALQSGGSISDNLYGDDALNTATAEDQRQITSDSTGSPGADNDYSYGSVILGPDGKGLSFQLTAFGRNGAVPDPATAIPQDGCLWSINGAKQG